MRPPAPPLLAVWTAALLAALVGCSGAANSSNPSNATNPSNSSNPRNRAPSCLPPGYRPRMRAEGPGSRRPEVPGEELDAKLAVVEGEVITRRRLVREAGPRAPGQSEEQYEMALRRRLLQRARLLLFVHEAQRVGIQVSPQRLDEVVQDNLQDRLREVEETTGRRVTVAQYLAEKNLTLEEFRDRAREELYYQAYLIRLLRGLGPEGRPQVDMTVTPAEVRRIYWSHPGAFDVKAGVHFVVWQVPVERYLTDDTGFLEAEAQARRDAEALAAAYRTGADPAELARRYELGEGEWKDSEDFASQEGLDRLIGSEATQWLFAPGRRPGEATVIEEGAGPLIVAVRELRAPERLSWEKAHDKIVDVVRFARQRRLEEQRLIDILQSRNVVEPDELADELLFEAMETLGKIDQDPVLGTARFR